MHSIICYNKIQIYTRGRPCIRLALPPVGSVKGEWEMSEYNGSLTREQFLFFEMRTVAGLLLEGCSKEEALQRIAAENLFQFPTERMVQNIANCCFKRLEALNSPALLRQLGSAPADVAKQINLYAMMRQNRLVWEFMTAVIGEKLAAQDYSFSRKDLNLFFIRLSEQDADVASWSESTVKKIKQVLTRLLVECGYLDSPKSEALNPVVLCPELEAGIRENRDTAAFAAFHYFE